MTQYYIFLALAIMGAVVPTNLYLIYFKKIFKFFPLSYSSSYGAMWAVMKEYLLKKKEEKHITHIFTFWTGLQVISMIPFIMLSDTTLELILSIGSSLALIIVGGFPTSVNKDITKVHCIAAKLCAAGAIVWLFLKGIYITTLVLCIGGLIWSRGWQKKYETLIMEYMAFMSVDVGVIICSLKALGVL